MTDMVALIRKVHAAVTAEREQRERRIADKWRRAAITTLCKLEVAFVQAAQAGGNLDCLAAKARALASIPGALPLTARHFRNGGVAVTADQLADQLIASMRAVTDGRIMSALPPKADLFHHWRLCPLMTQSGRCALSARNDHGAEFPIAISAR